MVILKYWRLIAAQLYSAAWGIRAGMAAIDLTLIGRIKGWRRIKYSKWLGGTINEKRRYGYEIVSDQTTHPQVIWFLLGRLVPSGANELSYRVAPSVNTAASMPVSFKSLKPHCSLLFWSNDGARGIRWKQITE